jgi:dynein light chain LC8-type|eukprot:Stramenopile-MAST_4_protein_4484
MSAKPVIKTSEMNPELSEKALRIAADAIEVESTEQHMAAYIKREMEKEVGGTWHCFVGRKFSSFVTHEQGFFIYFYVGQMGICLFKTV